MLKLKRKKKKHTKEEKEQQVRLRTVNRIAALVIIFISIIFVLLFRFMWIQFIKGNEYQKKAYRQQHSVDPIPGKRGTIYDSNMDILAISVESKRITINPKAIYNHANAGNMDIRSYQEKIARTFSELLGLDFENTLEKVQDKDKTYYVIKRQLDTDAVDIVKKWIKDEKIYGISFENDFTRHYPNGSLAAHILGFTGTDDQGLVCGVELALDKNLAARPGRIISFINAKGEELPFESASRIDPVDGENLVLTIDLNIQYMVEEALKETIDKHGIIGGGAVIVMDPNNGDVLAMASYPTFDLNSPYDCPPSEDPESWKGNHADSIPILTSTVWRNKALTDTYEPGSTFKSITAAASLEEGIVNRYSLVLDTPLELAGWTISCWKKPDHHGEETFEEALRNSCNPVFAKLAVQLGIKKYYSYLEAFGFKNKTGIKLTGEANSIIHTNPTEIDAAVAGFGQRLQITPIQLISAYCSIANGGKLYVPRIVKESLDDKGYVISRYEPELVRQVISKETANTVLTILEDTVSMGGGSNAYVSGYRVAGKTGTSETQETELEGRYIASFCGIAPSDKPEIVILVVLDHPTVGTASGGTQAAPLAGELIEKILEYKGIERRYTDLDVDKMLIGHRVPDLSEATIEEAINLLKSNRLSYKIVGDSKDDSLLVAKQWPQGGSLLSRNSVIVLYTDEEIEEEMVLVPDLKGLTIDEAYEKLKERGLNMRATSLGKVHSQTIEAGSMVAIASIVTVELINEDIEMA